MQIGDDQALSFIGLKQASARSVLKRPLHNLNGRPEEEVPLTPLEKLIQDNQISRAVDLIRGISLFNNKLQNNSKASVRKKVFIKKTDSAKN